MKINILSPGRFHVMDLARELSKLGHDVRFYSYVPDKRAKKFGITNKINRSCLWFLAPFLFLKKINSRKFKNLAFIAQDQYTALTMRKCDVLIAMSGVFIKSVERARHEGSKIIIERGSKHILKQKEILDKIVPGSVSDIDVKRELKSYALADYISIASQHVKDSFIEQGFSDKQLFVNPYGVDLSNFKPTNIYKKFDVIMVGTWCYRKGCDLLVEACTKLDLSLLHVGVIGDYTFPIQDKFTHVDKVDQIELINYYNQAKVFALPSREEGMALVQMQAISCGLPIVCSRHTGGLDIADVTPSKNMIFQMDDDSVDSLIRTLKAALSFYKSNHLTSLNLDGLSWSSYGKRYDTFIRNI